VNDQSYGRIRRTPRQTRLALCLWAIFAVGLAIQLVAPRLKIENHAFVMPPISDARSATLRPDVLVRRERWMQSVSGILAVGGALALGVYYRRSLAAALRG
jgi:cytochrome c-type biogenesis protein CcmE